MLMPCILKMKLINALDKHEYLILSSFIQLIKIKICLVRQSQ